MVLSIMKSIRRYLGLGLSALFVHCVVACGDDDEPSTSPPHSGSGGMRGGSGGAGGKGGRGGNTSNEGGAAGASAGASSDGGAAGAPTWSCEAAPVGGSDPLIADFSLNPEVLE